MAYPGQGKERISITDLIPCLSSISFFFLLKTTTTERSKGISNGCYKETSQ